MEDLKGAFDDIKKSIKSLELALMLLEDDIIPDINEWQEWKEMKCA